MGDVATCGVSFYHNVVKLVSCKMEERSTVCKKWTVPIKKRNNLSGATGEISIFYNLSPRLLIFDTHVPPIITTHNSKCRSCLSDIFLIMIFFLFGKRAYFQNLSPRTNLKYMI